MLSRFFTKFGYSINEKHATIRGFAINRTKPFFTLEKKTIHCTYSRRVPPYVFLSLDRVAFTFMIRKCTAESCPTLNGNRDAPNRLNVPVAAIP